MEKEEKNFSLSDIDDLSEDVRAVLAALLERDEKDSEIDKVNRENLTKQGLRLNTPIRAITVDTGAIIGAENVARFIKEQMAEGEKVLSIEGESGTGKGATAAELKKVLDGHIFSMGEVFRYLTHLFIARNGAGDIFSVFEKMSYRPLGGELKLFHGEFNVSDGLLLELRDKKTEAKIPEVAAFSQKPVIEFSHSQILKLKNSFDKPIIIEGRGFTIDFLPCDLIIKLSADPLIRARRRLKQTF